MVPKTANGMTHTTVLVALLLLPTTAVFSASQCDQASTAAASQLRLARASQNSMNHSAAHNENCDTVIKQFVEAVTARQAAATCEDSVSRQRALTILDAQIETFNERIADQSCGQ
jgi:hypothetical protein